jgi:LysM domain
MTSVDHDSSAAPADDVTRAADLVLPAACPYLGSADGLWRSTSANRDHRCGAVVPPAPLAAEKQRRLCLTAEHVGCATFEAAQATRSTVRERVPAPGRPVARGTPVVLDRGSLAVALPPLRMDRRSGQTVLIGLLAIAFAALMLGRLTGGGVPVTTDPPSLAPSAPGLGAGASTSVAPASPSHTPTTTPSAGATASGSATPRPSATGSRTYKVRAGDTLVGIAARFDTTPKKIRKLNGLTTQSTLKVGQVLQIP